MFDQVGPVGENLFQIPRAEIKGNEVVELSEPGHRGAEAIIAGGIGYSIAQIIHPTFEEVVMTVNVADLGEHVRLDEDILHINFLEPGRDEFERRGQCEFAGPAIKHQSQEAAKIAPIFGEFVLDVLGEGGVAGDRRQVGQGQHCAAKHARGRDIYLLQLFRG